MNTDTSNVINLDSEQQPLYVLDDIGVWREGYLQSEDPMAPEIHVIYSDRDGTAVQSWIPNDRDHVRVRKPGGGVEVARPDGHLDSLRDPRGKDSQFWVAPDTGRGASPEVQQAVREVLGLEPEEPAAYGLSVDSVALLREVQGILSNPYTLTPDRRHDCAEKLRLVLEDLVDISELL